MYTKWNFQTVQNSIAKMRKNGLMEAKKNKNVYFYDFDLIKGLPFDNDNFKNECINQTGLLSDFSLSIFLDTNKGIQYNVRLDFAVIKIYDDKKDKILYFIMECIGFSYSTFKINCYGLVSWDAIPTDEIKSGIQRRDVSYYIHEIAV